MCNYIRQGRYVIPGVCLSIRLPVCLFHCLFVCLLVTSRKNYGTDLHENITTNVSAVKEELIKFC